MKFIQKAVLFFTACLGLKVQAETTQFETFRSQFNETLAECYRIQFKPGYLPYVSHETQDFQFNYVNERLLVHYSLDEIADILGNYLAIFEKANNSFSQETKDQWLKLQQKYAAIFKKAQAQFPDTDEAAQLLEKAIKYDADLIRQNQELIRYIVLNMQRIGHDRLTKELHDVRNLITSTKRTPIFLMKAFNVIKESEDDIKRIADDIALVSNTADLSDLADYIAIIAFEI